MAQKRNRKVAVVQCLGGCHAEAVIPRGDLAGDCSQVLAEHPDGILKCKWGWYPLCVKLLMSWASSFASGTN